MRSIEDPLVMPRRPTLADVTLGILGGGVIRVVLALAWLRARVTRSPWHG